MKTLIKKIVQYYLWLLTKITIARHRPEIIAIAGTTNKTKVKEAITKAFADEGTRANPRSYNTEIGLPLAVLYLPSGYSNFWQWLKILAKGTWIALFGRKFPAKLILELGVDRPRDMDYLLTLVRPKAAVITEIVPAYMMDGFKNLDDMAKEYEKLIKSLPKEGLAVLNYDDLRVRGLSDTNPNAKCLLYGLGEGADIRAINIKDTAEGQSFDIEFKGQKMAREIPEKGLSHVYASLAAFALKEAYGEIK